MTALRNTMKQCIVVLCHAMPGKIFPHAVSGTLRNMACKLAIVEQPLPVSCQFLLIAQRGEHSGFLMHDQLVDTGDVIVHIFRPEVRAYYDIEGMWSVPEPEKTAKPAKKPARGKKK